MAAGTRRRIAIRTTTVVLGALLAPAAPLTAQQNVIEMTLERMVDLTLSSSYRIRNLNLGVEATRQRLRSEQSRLRSQVALELSVPTLESIAEPR